MPKILHKKAFWIPVGFIIFFSVVILPVLALGMIVNEDKAEIQERIGYIKDAVNSGDIEALSSLISPNMPSELREEILNQLSGKEINFQQEIRSFKRISPNKIKVKGRFSARGLNWSVSGLSNYYVFEKVNGEWLLLDTNFHQKLSSGFVIKVMGKMFAIIVPIFLLCFGFWLWMLIDCTRRPIDNKTVWILLIVFLQLLGAILYFFIARRKQDSLIC